MWSIFFCSTFWFKLVCTINHPPRPFILEAYLVTGDVWPMERVWNKQFTRYSSWSWNHHHSIHLNGCIALALVVLSLLSLFMIFNFSFFYYFNIYMFDFRRSSVGTFMRQPTETSKSKVPPPKLDYRSMVSVDDMPELFVSFDSKCNFMKYSTLWTLLFMNCRFKTNSNLDSWQNFQYFKFDTLRTNLRVSYCEKENIHIFRYR